MKKLLIVAAFAFIPSVAVADPGECDSATKDTNTPRCFNITPGNPFYVPPNQGDFTGSIGSQPAPVYREPGARRQTHSDR